MRYKIDLDDFTEDIFHQMDCIQDGGSAHYPEYEGEDENDAAKKISEKLTPFIKKHLIFVETKEGNDEVQG